MVNCDTSIQMPRSYQTGDKWDIEMCSSGISIRNFLTYVESKTISVARICLMNGIQGNQAAVGIFPNGAK